MREVSQAESQNPAGSAGTMEDHQSQGLVRIELF